MFNLRSHSGPRAQTLGTVVHGTRSGKPNNPSEFQGTINWCADPANQASYNDLIDRDGTWAQLMDPWLQAWHAGYMNPHYHSLAFAQSTADEPITPAAMETAVRVVALRATQFTFPGIALYNRTNMWPGSGIVQHQDCYQGAIQGKSDVGANFDTVTFATRVRRLLGT